MAERDPSAGFRGQAMDLLMVVLATFAFVLARLLSGNFWLACAAGGVVLALMLFSVYGIGDRQE